MKGIWIILMICLLMYILSQSNESQHNQKRGERSIEELQLDPL